ncbi:MAG: 50S ribosomal protein L25 [Puniceicoccales bacterium]|jgi:large subunit ribosomal protein L25|nr:50S ribosomal protein L25 [Puniceicoccales bacterium]
MKNLQISVSQRSEIGSCRSKRLRRQGRIPAVVYGKSGHHPISLSDKDFRILMKEKGNSAATVELINVDSKVLSIMAEVQRDAISDKFTHVGFHEISENEKIHMVVPIKLIGESYGVKNENGVIEQVRHELSVRCLPKDMIEYVVIDVSALKLGDSIHIKDVFVAEGVELAANANDIVLSCVGQNEAKDGETSIPVNSKSKSTAAAKS